MTCRDLEATARRRAGAKLGWYIHAMAYIGVNLLLAALSYASGRPWAVFPALGWGLGLAIHGVVVFPGGPGSRLRERLVAIERARLAAQRDAAQAP